MNNMGYIQVPNRITYENLKEKHSLSPSSYKTLVLKNNNVKRVGEILSGSPQNGREVGSFSYINKSNFYFIRTKALQTSYLLPVLNNVECAVSILPKVFKNFELREGDILISKDANIGEVAILDKDLPNYMISGGIVRLRFPEEMKYYVFGFMKSKFFRSQIELMTERGATIRHAKTLWQDALIPFPKQENENDVIKFVNLLIKAIIRKETEIKWKYYKIMDLIDKELNENQKPNKFYYTFPTLKDLQETGRLDASIYSVDFKRIINVIENYKNGYETLQSFGFKARRGPNLAVSVIGKSIYCEEARENFYRLIEPMDITDFMTIKKFRWLGNKTKIPLLKKGDILFGAEGSIGKVYIICEDIKNTITNYHGMSINKKENNPIELKENIFVGCFFSFMKEQGIFNKICVGGQGGSVGKDKLLNLKIPNFPHSKKEEIAKYYYNPVNYKNDKLNLLDFENEDKKITAESGIWQLDKQITCIKQKIDTILYKIIMDKEVNISFDFLNKNG